jgi:hypothetical protein
VHVILPLCPLDEVGDLWRLRLTDLGKLEPSKNPPLDGSVDRGATLILPSPHKSPIYVKCSVAIWHSLECTMEDFHQFRGLFEANTEPD